jgi:predicted RNA-binding protein YlqC (UPF0109 family)
MKENMAKEVDREFLEYVIKSLVDHPEDVQIDRKGSGKKRPRGV